MANGKRNTKMQRRNRKRSNAVGKTKVTKATEMKKENERNKIFRISKSFQRNIYPQRGTELIYSTTGSNNEMKVDQKIGSNDVLKRQKHSAYTTSDAGTSKEGDFKPQSLMHHDFTFAEVIADRKIISHEQKLHDRKSVMVSDDTRRKYISHEETQSKKRKLSDIDSHKEQSNEERKKPKVRYQNSLMPVMSPQNRHKYWQKRHSLFSRFDEGIQLDEESFYSATPEKIAREQANNCKCNVIIDAFCGAGGNTIQFAMTCNKVIAIDIDPKKIEMARKNAAVYNVDHKIEFIVGDFLELVNDLKADVVFMSPPWGGPSYIKKKVYDLKTMLKPASITILLSAANQISKDVAIFLPRNSDTKPLKEAGCAEIEENFSKTKLIGITAYFNNLPKKH